MYIMCIHLLIVLFIYLFVVEKGRLAFAHGYYACAFQRKGWVAAVIDHN